MTLTAHPARHRGAAGPAQPTTRVAQPAAPPRLLLVAASVVVGARLMAAADDTVGVWVLSRDLPAGATVEEGDLTRRQVRFPDDPDGGWLSRRGRRAPRTPPP